MTDEELAALIDNMSDGEDGAQPGTAFSFDDFEVISVTKRAVKLEKKPNKPVILKNKWRVVLISGLSAAAIVCIMLLSPFHVQYIESGLGRGMTHVYAIDSLVASGNYLSALEEVNADIATISEGLPGAAFLDRFLPEKRRYEVSLARAEIYELQWKQIGVLSAMGDESALHQSLKDYVGIAGYHQQEAQNLLSQLEGK